MAVPVDAQRLCEIVHAAYNPGRRSCSRKRAPPASPPTCAGSDVGPERRRGRGDQATGTTGARSITWAMTPAPRGEVRENVLARLIAPHPDIARKRVTLLYRHDQPRRGGPDRRARPAQRRVSRRLAPTSPAPGRSSSRAPRGRPPRKRPAAPRCMNFGMLVTATVLRSGQLRAAQVGDRQPRRHRPRRAATGLGLTGLRVCRRAAGRVIPARPSARFPNQSGQRYETSPAAPPCRIGPTPGPRHPGPRGWARARARGTSTLLQAPSEWRATTVQSAGCGPSASAPARR